MPLGKAAIRREGSDVTVLAYGTMVHVALAAAEKPASMLKVIDLRTLLPFDTDTIMASAEEDQALRNRA